MQIQHVDDANGKLGLIRCMETVFNTFRRQPKREELKRNENKKLDKLNIRVNT